MAAMAKLLRSLLPSRPAARPSVALGEGWVRPHWLERAGGPAVAGTTNEDQRRWTVIGSVDSPPQPRVDERGLVPLDGRAWSIETGRSSCRARVCKYVLLSVVD